MRIAIIGGGAAGMGAAGAARQTNQEADVVLFTEYEDIAYSPCGIPYVHGREIESFEPLFLQDKEFYRQQRIDVRYETVVTKVDLDHSELHIAGGGTAPFDHLILCTGFEWVVPDVPGAHLEGIHYPKNIRRSMEFDQLLDQLDTVVVVGGTSLGIEMAGGFARRGLRTHLVDPHPWLLTQVADPDIMESVEESLVELGVEVHLRTELEEFLGEDRVQAVGTSAGELATDVVVMCDKRRPNTRLARDAGLKIGSTGGVIVDERLATTTSGVFAAGDILELPHGITGVPIQGATGSHSYAQGKVAGANAAGGNRTYRPIYVPWGLVAGKWAVGGAGFGEHLAETLDVPYVMAVGQGISRARYYPGFKTIRVKLLADPDSRVLIGGQLVGGEGIKERADFLGMAVRKRLTADDIAWMENVYAPPIGAVMEPMAIAAQNLVKELDERHEGTKR